MCVLSTHKSIRSMAISKGLTRIEIQGLKVKWTNVLLSTYYVPGTFPGPGDSECTTASYCFHAPPHPPQSWGRETEAR